MTTAEAVEVDVPDDDALLTIRETAEMVHLHPRTVLGLVHAGAFRAVKVGRGNGRWRIYRASVRAYLRAGESGQRPAAETGDDDS